MQDELFYMTNRLNLTVITRACAYANRFNKTSGTWYGTPQLNGGMGMLQNREVDIVTTLTGMNLQRSEYVDFSLPTRRAFSESPAAGLSHCTKAINVQIQWVLKSITFPPDWL